MFCLPLEFAQLVSVTGRSGMTSVAWILAVCFHVKPETDVVVKTGTDGREGEVNPETGRYSGVVVILTEVCVKIV